MHISPKMDRIEENTLLLIKTKHFLLGKEIKLSKEKLLKRIEYRLLNSRPMLEIDFEFLYYAICGVLTGPPLESTKKVVKRLSRYHNEENKLFIYSLPILLLGIAFYQDKKYQKAISAFKEALDIFPENLIVWENLIKATKELGQESEARKYTKKYQKKLLDFKNKLSASELGEERYSNLKEEYELFQEKIQRLDGKYKQIFPETGGTLDIIYHIVKEIKNYLEGNASVFSKHQIIEKIDDISEGYHVWISLVADLIQYELTKSEHRFEPNEKLKNDVMEILGWKPKPINKQDCLNLPKFYDPEYRKKSWQKTLGVDVLTLKFHNSIMDAQYTHIDGNFTNDNPETHGWLFKESLAAINPQAHGPTPRNTKASESVYLKEILNHINNHLGTIYDVHHIQSFPVVNLDIITVDVREKLNYSLLITSGMSEKAMEAPPNSKNWWGLDFDKMNVPPQEQTLFELKYAELIIKLPNSWEFTNEMKNTWPIMELCNLVHYVHTKHQWFWTGHTMRARKGRYLGDNSKLAGWLFLFPPNNLPEKFCSLPLNRTKAIYFLQLIPLYYEEIQFAMRNGYKELIKLFNKHYVPDYIDLHRKNVCI